jgi:hypothetical protein
MTFALAKSTLRYRGLGMADSILSSVIRRRPRAGLSQPSARPPSPSETKHVLITRTATSGGNMADSSTIIRGRRGGNDNPPRHCTARHFRYVTRRDALHRHRPPRGIWDRHPRVARIDRHASSLRRALLLDRKTWPISPILQILHGSRCLLSCNVATGLSGSFEHPVLPGRGMVLMPLHPEFQSGMKPIRTPPLHTENSAVRAPAARRLCLPSHAPRVTQKPRKPGLQPICCWRPPSVEAVEPLRRAAIEGKLLGR